MGGDFSEASEKLVSHGICKECTAAVFGSKKYSLMDFLDSLNAPVLTVDTEGKVGCANKQAREILQKEMPDIEGLTGGDVFACSYAHLPDGCGGSFHCDACTIRNTVMSTFQTGEGYLRIPAFLMRGTPDDTYEIQFLISTEKVADVVLLRIDKVGEH